MRLKHWLALFLVLSMAGCEGMCTKIPSCGIFTFTGSKVDTSTVNGLDMNLSYDFNPADCGSNCSCNTVAYIQIVRTVDMEDSTYIYPSSEKEERANDNGWYIDRLEGKKWGYYGRNDDGSFASTLDPGSENDPAILFDAPSRGEAEPWIDIWWQAVSVPVCIQNGSGCENKLLGYYFWSWVVEPSGVVNDPIHAIAWEDHDGEVDLAVEKWNIQAPTLGKNTFPAFTRLP